MRSPSSVMNSIEDRLTQYVKKIDERLKQVEHEANRTPLVQTPGSDFDRLLNQNKSFEGGGILPQPGAGRRLPNVTGLTLARNTSVIGGAQLTLTWNDETLEILDRVQVQVWASADFNRISSLQNINDINLSTLVRYSAPVIFDTSPGEIFVPASQRMPVVITVGTLHSSGVVSLKDFQSSVATTVVPLGSKIATYTASFEVPTIGGVTYFLDTTSGGVVATLPPVKAFPDGSVLNFKKISTDANSITIGGSENIDNFASFISSAPFISYTIVGDHRGNQWWRIY